jgi:hypothetical protein
MAICKINLEEENEAMKFIENAIKSDPTYPKPYFRKV